MKKPGKSGIKKNKVVVVIIVAAIVVGVIVGGCCLASATGFIRKQVVDGKVFLVIDGKVIEVDGIWGELLEKVPDSGKSYEPKAHYEKPVIEDTEELTAEYLVKKLDIYSWELANYWYSYQLTQNGFDPATNLSAQFDRISVPTSRYYYDDYEEVKESLFYYHPWGDFQLADITFADVYSFNFHFDLVMIDMPLHEALFTAVDENTFEAIADNEYFGAEKIDSITRFHTGKIPDDYSIDYINALNNEGYKFFEMTREELLNITDPELLKRLDEFINATIDNSRKLYPEEYIQDLELSQPYDAMMEDYNLDYQS